jgi:c-di-GMP-binding flagellar brake protein YcgR
MDNKRAYPRFSLSESVAYQRPSLNSPSGSLSANISLGGIKITAHEFIPVGTVLQMQINFSNPQRTVSVKGKVLRVAETGYGERYEMGIEFLKDPETVQALSSALNARRFELI